LRDKKIKKAKEILNDPDWRAWLTKNLDSWDLMGLPKRPKVIHCIKEAYGFQSYKNFEKGAPRRYMEPEQPPQEILERH